MKNWLNGQNHVYNHNFYKFRPFALKLCHPMFFAMLNLVVFTVSLKNESQFCKGHFWGGRIIMKWSVYIVNMHSDPRHPEAGFTKHFRQSETSYQSMCTTP